MKDGTVVIGVDLRKNIALFAPENIFGGNSDFDHQDGVVAKANAKSMNGHKDWRRITDKEASTLAKNWKKVAPPELQGDAAPLFWSACTDTNKYFGVLGRSYSGNDSAAGAGQQNSLAVPVVRSGPARRFN